MISELMIPFQHDYMVKAMWVSALFTGHMRILVGFPDAEGVVADGRCPGPFDRARRSWCLSAAVALRSRRVSGWPVLQPFGMAFVRAQTRLREDAIIGLCLQCPSLRPDC